MFDWEKKGSLSEQLKFFGAKKQSFISCYAKKPRIVMKVKSIATMNPATKLARDRQLSALYQSQLNRGTQHGALGFQQMAMAQTQSNNALCGGLGTYAQGMGNIGAQQMSNLIRGAYY